MSTVTTAPTTTREGDKKLSQVWQPLQLGPSRLKNRIVVPARILNYSHTGVLSDRHLNVYRELAQGGPALIITEQHAAHPISQGSFYNPCSAWEYAAIPRFEKLAAIGEEHDCRTFVQLFGPGVHDKGTMMVDSWHELWGVSEIPSFVHGEKPMVMEKRHIDSLIEGFARSADNARRGGLDGVELHAAHSYLLGQFLSHTYNKRTDQYGGSTQNRCRVVVEIAEAVRAKIGSDLTLGVRLSYDEFLGPQGIEPEEAEAQIEILAATGLFDYFSISGGSYHTLHLAVPPMGSVEEGFMVPFAKRAKELIGDRGAVFTVGRIRDLHRAEDALVSGSADAVAMGRAQLADPHIVRKTKEGRENEIVRCFGINECIGRLFDQNEVVCAMNPHTAREHKWPQGKRPPARKLKDVVVVGGGPSGMKTAAVAASRGHRVTLYEREKELGGHLRLLSKMPTRQEWAIAIDNLVREVDNGGVTVRLGEEVSAEKLREVGGDALVLATGSGTDMSGLSAFRPDRDSIPGSDQDHVIPISDAAWKALEDPSALGKKVIIFDQSGNYLQAGVAEILAENGAEVEIVTPQMFLGEHLNRRLDLPHVMPRLSGLGVKQTAQHMVESIDGAKVTITGIWGGQPRIEDDVDTVIFASYRVPDEDLYRKLGEDSGFAEVHRVGDCLAPRQFSAIIYDGERLAREL